VLAVGVEVAFSRGDSVSRWFSKASEGKGELGFDAVFARLPSLLAAIILQLESGALGHVIAQAKRSITLSPDNGSAALSGKQRVILVGVLVGITEIGPVLAEAA